MEEKMISTEATIIEQIASDHGAEVRSDQELRNYTSMGVGGKAAHMIFPKRSGPVEQIIHELSTHRLPFRILGAGTNLIIGDDGLDDIIIATESLSRKIDVAENIIRASSGVPISRLIRNCAESGLGGLEFAEGIPGTIGGATIMNAGSYGRWISEYIREVSFISDTGKPIVRKCSPDDFGYRRSPFHSGFFLSEIVFEFVKKEREKILAEIEEVKERRRTTQPWGVKSSGCIFKNPEGEHAGKIIEEAGLKGLQRGGAMVSTVHANFIVNTGNARAQDIFWLIETIKNEVHRKMGIVLEEEVIIWKR